MSDDNFRKALSDALTTYYETSIPYIEEHDFSPDFDKKMEKLINRCKKPYFKMINTMSKKVACVAGVFLIASSVTIMSVDALRNRIADLFVKQSKDHSIIRYEGNDISPSSIEDIYEITYDLSGFDIVYTDYDNFSRYTTYIKDNTTIYFNQYVKEFYDVNVNTEDAELSTITINGHEAIYFLDNRQYYHLIWDNGDYIISLSSNIGKDALIDIAESVKKVEK
mgnify:CR=1 FL=1